MEGQSFVSIYKRPIFAELERVIAGRMLNIIVNPDTGKLEALQVGFPFSAQKRLVSPVDVRSTEPPYIIIGSADNLYEQNELVRADRIISGGYKTRGAAVVTENGDRLGKVVDFFVDFGTSMLTKIQVKKLDIPYNQIVKIEPDKIIVKDAFVRNPVRETALIRA